MNRLFKLFLLPFFAACSFNEQNDSANGFKNELTTMLKSQIISRGITNQRVLAAIKSVPRHKFVPKEIQEFAYEDRPLPIGFNQTISQPFIVAAMTQAIAPQPHEKILEIGTGSGYQAAILAQLSTNVYSIEIIPELADRAKKTLNEIGITNVYIKCDDGFNGWKEYAPFDAIIVTCAPDAIPQPLINQLADNGRIIIPVGGNYGQELIKVTKKDGKLISEKLMNVIFVPMTGKAQK